jgi:hypothetical protein
MRIKTSFKAGQTFPHASLPKVVNLSRAKRGRKYFARVMSHIRGVFRLKW